MILFHNVSTYRTSQEVIIQYIVQYLAHHMFCSLSFFVMKNTQFLKLTPSQLIVLSEAQMKLRVRKYPWGCRVPRKEMISRSIVVCFGDSFIKQFLPTFNQTCMIFSTFHSNFSNQGVRLLTFEIKESKMKIKESEMKNQQNACTCLYKSVFWWYWSLASSKELYQMQLYICQYVVFHGSFSLHLYTFIRFQIRF